MLLLLNYKFLKYCHYFFLLFQLLNIFLEHLYKKYNSQFSLYYHLLFHQHNHSLEYFPYLYNYKLHHRFIPAIPAICSSVPIVFILFVQFIIVPKEVPTIPSYCSSTFNTSKKFYIFYDSIRFYYGK